MMHIRELRGWLARLFGMFNRKRREREFAEELESHLQMHIEDNLRSGMTTDEARRQALIQLGGVEATKEAYRDQRGLPGLETLWQDVRYGARMLRKNPGFTVVAVLTLALGIGANTAMFSVVNAVLLRPLPFPDPERLMLLEAKGIGYFAAPDFRDLATQNRSFSHLAAYSPDATFNLSGGGAPERIQGARISSSLLPTLGVQPLHGRNFTEEEDREGGEKVVLLNHGLWQRQFGADPEVVGRTIRLDEESHTVIGVLPPGLNFPSDRELFVPLTLAAFDLNNYQGYFLQLIARLKADVTRMQADAELATIIKPGGESPRFERVRVLGLHEALVGDVRTMMLVLMGAVGFVVLIACANLANLLLTAATWRQKELAVRLSLGSTRGRVVRQFVIESLLLAGLGGIAGLAITYGGMTLVNAWLPGTIPRVGAIEVDGRVLGFTSALTVMAGLLFGIFPALRASQTALTEALKQGSRTLGGNLGSQRLRAMLVVSQVALTVVLLTGAGLLLKSFVRLQQTPLGFRPERLLTARIALPSSTYATPQQRRGFADRLLEEIRRQPGMQEAALTSYLPFATGNRGFRIFMNGQEQIEPGMPIASFRSVSPDYFRVMGIPLLKGREFSSADHERAPMVAVINETMARRYWPDSNPIGQRIKETSNEGAWREIVGVVGSVRHGARGEEPRPEMFVPWSQSPAPTLNLAVRTQAEPASLGAALRQAVTTADANLPLFEVRTMEERLSQSVAQPRFRTILLGSFAALALVMAAVGLYAVMAFSVAQRTHELGIRVALGAQRRDVLSLVVGQGMRLVWVGLGIGMAAALAFSRVLQTLLFEVKPTDPMTFAAISLLLAAVAVFACVIPARRASKVDPMVALRNEG